MHVELLDVSSGNEEVYGTVRMDNGQVVVEGDVPARVKRDIEFERRHTDVGDEAFLLRLEQRVFTGRYLRARFVK